MLMRPFSVTWWDDPEVDFDLSSPWWWAGQRILKITEIVGKQQNLVVGAVMATSAEDAKAQIRESYIEDVDLEWRFVEEQPHGWSPFTRERPRNPDMIWDQRPH